MFVLSVKKVIKHRYVWDSIREVDFHNWFPYSREYSSYTLCLPLRYTSCCQVCTLMRITVLEWRLIINILISTTKVANAALQTMWVRGRISQRAATLESTTNNIAYDGQISEEEKRLNFFTGSLNACQKDRTKIQAVKFLIHSREVWP